MAVEALLARSVSRDSVSSCLSTGARAGRFGFERVARGRYQLARLVRAVAAQPQRFCFSSSSASVAPTAPGSRNPQRAGVSAQLG